VRLETLGFDKVHEYRAGKLDWLAAGRPTEGENNNCPRAGDASRKDAIVCGLKDRVGDVRDQARAAGSDLAVVVDDERVVLGMLWLSQLEMDPNLVAEQAMRPGPSTYRPYVSIKEMADHLVERNHDSVPITTSDGKLVGVLYKSEAVRLAASATACVRKMIT
jgi:predicted transcriptional regulator